MKKQKSIKLALLHTLSNPDISVTSYTIHNDYDVIPDNDESWSLVHKQPNGRSTYIIEIYKTPTK